MKKLGFALGLLIVWICIFFILVEIFPIHLMTISLLMIYILVLALILPCFAPLWNKKEFKNINKAKKILENSDKLSNKEYIKFIKKVLYTINYGDLEKYERNNYYIDFVCGNTLFNLKKRTTPVDVNIVNRISEAKIFENKSIIIISNTGFTENALNSDKDVILWDKKRLFELLDKCEKKKNNNIEKLAFSTLEDLDFMEQEMFQNSVFELLKIYYKFENDLFTIDGKPYSALCINSGFKNKITKERIDVAIENIYSKGAKNVLIITNGYYENYIKEYCEKLQITVWDRDNLSYLLKNK